MVHVSHQWMLPALSIGATAALYHAYKKARCVEQPAVGAGLEETSCFEEIEVSRELIRSLEEQCQAAQQD
eukprot:5649099-Prymnesium_polylepis.1